MHGEVGEEYDKVLLHSDDEARVPLVPPGDHLDVVAHSEVLSQLVSRELQRVLQAHTREEMELGQDDEFRKEAALEGDRQKCVHLQVFVFGHEGDLVAVHTQDLSLQVDQLSLTHLHVVSGLQVVFSFLPCKHSTVDVYLTHNTLIFTSFNLCLNIKFILGLVCCVQEEHPLLGSPLMAVLLMHLKISK